MPPNPYFSGINYNPSFFSTVAAYLTEAIANSKYLKIIGGTLNGFLGILRTPRVALDVNGKAVINDITSGAPANGQFGGNGTKLILAEGGVVNTPIALGTQFTSLWYGVSGTGNHVFYTGTNERMRILDNGDVGLSSPNMTNLISSRLTVNDIVNDRWTYNHNTSPATITNQTPTGSTVINDPVPILNICRQGGGAPASYGVRSTFKLCRYENTGGSPWSRSRMDIFLARNEYSDEVNVMTMRSDGRVGIGTNAPQTLVHLHSPFNTTDYSIQMTDNTTGTTATSGIAIQKTNLQDMFLKVYGNARMYFFTNNLVRMNILANGNVGIGAPTPDTISQIFQVGDGARLRISNNTADVSIIGTKEGNDVNNTRIELSGSTRSSRTGYIDYHATTGNGLHVFFVNGLSIGNFSTAGFGVNNGNISLSDGSFRNGGFAIARSGKYRSGSGALVYGYFIDPVVYSNTMIISSFSHDSTSYSVWNGRISVNKNGAITDIINFYAPNSMYVDNFIELTTLKSWIYIDPNTSYNPLSNLLAKLYG
jgi:hypothetical protein